MLNALVIRLGLEQDDDDVKKKKKEARGEEE